MPTFAALLRLLPCLATGLIAAAAASVTGLAQAQSVQLEVSGVGSGQIPVAIAPFAAEESAPAKVSQIIISDLLRSGQFRNIDASGVVLNENSRPDFKLWRARTADALAAGSVQAAGNGYELRFGLWDNLKGQNLTQESLRVPASSLRYGAHRAADIIYEKLTGEKGIFATRVAYISKSDGLYKLWIADAADGEGAIAAVTSREPIISPTFSPRGDELA